MDRISAPEQNRLLGRLADMLRMTEGQASAPEFLPPQLNVMNLVRQLMLPSAETVEKMSYGDPLFRMPQQSRIPITTDKQYLADIVGMVPFTAPAARPSARAMQDLVRQIQTTPPVGAIQPPKFEMPSFARLQPETAEDIDKIFDFLEEKAKKAGYKIETNSSNVSASRYLTIYEDLPNDDIRSIELRVSNHADRHPFSYADERISIDPSSVDLEEALYMLQDKGYNLFGK